MWYLYLHTTGMNHLKIGLYDVSVSTLSKGQPLFDLTCLRVRQNLSFRRNHIFPWLYSESSFVILSHSVAKIMVPI